MIFQAWRCVIGDARVTYVSGPITTGSAWIEAVEAGHADQKDDVIAANSRNLIEAATELRRNNGDLVIEPASLSVRSWSQVDYLTLWTDLIERHAGGVRFLPDWPYSNGCAHEFERAVQHGIPTLTLEGQDISRETGMQLLRDAEAALIRKAGLFPALEPLRDAVRTVVARMTAAAAA
jgi:hypothetical protein